LKARTPDNQQRLVHAQKVHGLLIVPEL